MQYLKSRNFKTFGLPNPLSSECSKKNSDYNQLDYKTPHKEDEKNLQF